MPETQTPEPEAAVETRAAPPSPAAPAADPSPDAIRTEANRSAADVLALCERHALGAGFAADLIRRGLSLDAARAAILDKLAEADAPATRGSEPAAATARGTGAADGAYRDAMSEALLHRHNPGRAQLTDRAREFRGLTLLELARHALDRRGIATRGMSKMELATEALIGRSGLHSTSDFPLILANVANKTLRAAYDTTPRTFTAWARRAVITDFKPVARNQLGGAPDLLRVPESGEFTYGTIGESREVYGRALDDLRAKHYPLFAVVREYRSTLNEIRQAHRVGAISAEEMTAAIVRERQATLASTAAIKGRTIALGGMSTANHPKLNTQNTPYTNCSPGRRVISTLSMTYAPKPVIPASFLRRSPRPAYGLAGHQSGRIGKAAVPPGPIRMRGSAAHAPASVRGRK